MNLKEIYDLAIKKGMEADPRGTEGVNKALKRYKEEFEDLPKSKKDEFDQEVLNNPYSDTRILFGDESSQVDSILAGIDIDVGEVLLADRLREKGEGIDLVIGHHPHGSSLAALHEVMDLQVDVLVENGVPVHIAERLMNNRITEVKRRLGPHNHYQSVDAARLLNVPFLVTHTITDNLVHKFIGEYLKQKGPETVGEVMKALKEIPEYKQATLFKAGPEIVAGSEKNRAGKIALEMTGGTEGSKEIYEHLSRNGVGTIVGMHLGEEHFKEASKHHLNVIIAGHMVSDSIGMNLFLDELEKRGVKIIPCSGLIRVSRAV